jgi:hypothetical protein
MRLILIPIICLSFFGSLFAKTNNNHAKTKTIDTEQQLKISNRPYTEIFNPDKRFEITGKIDHDF